MKILGWVLLAIVALVAIWAIFFREEKKTSACGKAVGGATVGGTTVGESTGETICDIAAKALDYTIGPDSVAQKINTGITGVDVKNFKTFNELTDAQNLGQNMCNCYHGNEAACTSALEQSPGLRCKVGDCDCHITDTSGQVIHDRDVHEIHYRDSKGGPYTATVGPKVPVGGCQANTPGAASNRAAGFCGTLAALTNTIGGTKKAA